VREPIPWVRWLVRIVVVAAEQRYTRRMTSYQWVKSGSGSSTRSAPGVIAASVALIGLGWSATADAAVVFSNGFESGDLSGWDYELNPEGLSVVTAPEPVLAGTYALRAELTSETVWENGIFRTEVQHKPDEARAADGAELYFGWSIYLPKALPEGDYQLGYFETRNTYQQVFSLHAEGSDLSLYVNKYGEGSPSSHPGLLEVGKWHRIVYHVKWSADRFTGEVSLWWDGVKLVDAMHGKTYLADPALVQLGLLKNPPEPPEPIVLYVDEVIEGDSYADVSAGVPEVGAPAPAPTDTSGAIAPVTSTAVVTDTAPATGTVSPGGATGAGNTAPVTGATDAPPAEGEAGCSVSRVNGANAGVFWGLAWSLAAWVMRRSVRRA
jgi:hypothetical protein